TTHCSVLAPFGRRFCRRQIARTQLRTLPEFAALLARIDADLAAQRAQLRARNLPPAEATSERG
ncbi:hypothetical protein XarCFBP6762_21470, partial [Xanthomonas arboricola]